MKKGLTATMVAADPLIVFSVFYFLFIAGALIVRDAGQAPTVPFLVGSAYFFVLMLLLTWGVYRDEYPWFLASWTEERPETAGNRLFGKRYSFSKLRYRLSRAVRRSTMWTDRDLFVRAYAYELALETSNTDDPEGQDGERALGAKERPGLRELVRAFNLRFNKVVGLTRGKEQSKAIDAEVDALRNQISHARTYLDGYLRYLLEVYLDYPPAVRDMMYEQTRFRAVLGLLPKYQPTLSLIATLLILFLVWIVFGTPIPFWSP